MSENREFWFAETGIKKALNDSQGIGRNCFVRLNKPTDSLRNWIRLIDGKSFDELTAERDLYREALERMEKKSPPLYALSRDIETALEAGRKIRDSE